MRLTRQTDYAIRVALDLAGQPGHGSDVRAIAGRQRVPEAYAAKIVQALARAGLVVTARGARGGVRLARDPAKVTAARDRRGGRGAHALHPLHALARRVPASRAVRAPSDPRRAAGGRAGLPAKHDPGGAGAPGGAASERRGGALRGVEGSRGAGADGSAAGCAAGLAGQGAGHRAVGVLEVRAGAHGAGRLHGHGGGGGHDSSRGAARAAERRGGGHGPGMGRAGHPAGPIGVAALRPHGLRLRAGQRCHARSGLHRPDASPDGAGDAGILRCAPAGAGLG
ncbi:MAG: Rrf2 family transcriptional regulator [Limnochordaceae bacterium]|nr:Rrf2 family transcriptional regulator [Limnochordaceae bacterium]